MGAHCSRGYEPAFYAFGSENKDVVREWLGTIQEGMDKVRKDDVR
jgi:hypothetical protein